MQLPINIDSHPLTSSSEEGLKKHAEAMEKLGWAWDKRVYTYKTANTTVYIACLISAHAVRVNEDSPRLLISL